MPEKSCHSSATYRTLYAGLPGHRNARTDDRLDCHRLAQAVGISGQALHGWFVRDQIPAKRIRSLVKLPGSTLDAETLLEISAQS